MAAGRGAGPARPAAPADRSGHRRGQDPGLPGAAGGRRWSRGGGRAVVSTHTRALQTPDPGTGPAAPGGRCCRASAGALLMGRRNYLCLRQRQAFLSRPVESLADALRAVAFRLWLDDTTDGLREELAGHPLLGPGPGRALRRGGSLPAGPLLRGRPLLRADAPGAGPAKRTCWWSTTPCCCTTSAQGRTLIGERGPPGGGRGPPPARGRPWTPTASPAVGGRWTTSRS